MGPQNPAHRFPDEVDRARQEGRFRPGRGPWYCIRILPVAIPVRRQELLASGITRWKVDHAYLQVAPGVMLPDTGDNLGSGAYRHCIISRSRAQLINHPTCILGGWGAAGYHGLRYWADSAPVLLLSDSLPTRGSDRTLTASRHPLRAAVRAIPPGVDPDTDTVTPDPAFPGFRVVSAPVAVAQCLRSVLSGKHSWSVVRIPGLTPREIRAVQLLDAFAQCTTVTRAEISLACRGIVSARIVGRLLDLAAAGAESPRETELRLFVRHLLPAGHRWETQVKVQWTEMTPGKRTRTRMTFFDLACRELQLGLYYDGRHHDAEAQTEKDFEQLQDLRDQQWTVIRVNRNLMANPEKMLGQIRRAVQSAAAQAPLPHVGTAGR